MHTTSPTSLKLPSPQMLAYLQVIPDLFHLWWKLPWLAWQQRLQAWKPWYTHALRSSESHWYLVFLYPCTMVDAQTCSPAVVGYPVHSRTTRKHTACSHSLVPVRDCLHAVWRRCMWQSTEPGTDCIWLRSMLYGMMFVFYKSINILTDIIPKPS